MSLLPQTILNPEEELIKDLASFSKDPYGFVLYSFPWGKGDLKNFTGPEPWQKDILCQIGEGLLTLQEAIQEAIASGHGVGKSTLVAWLILWAMSTHEDTRGVVTANTDTQLRTKTWSELSKWYQIFIAKHWFSLTATAIYSNQPDHDKTWRIDIIPWTEEKSEAFAGLHNQGKRIIVIFDEASAIPEIIWDTTEGALTDKNTEIIWCVFGNPTRNTGRFFECFNRNKHRWNRKQVDSRTVSFTNKEQINKWIQDYGEDSDFVKIRVRGEFPSTSDRQFIPTKYVDDARARKYGLDKSYYEAKIIGVDCAWSNTGRHVIVLRQGLCSKILGIYIGVKDDYAIAGYLADFETREQAEAVHIDLGFGTGIFSAGKQMKRNWVLVPFGSASNDPGYANKRAEMWSKMKQWLLEGGSIPDHAELAAELTSPEYLIGQRGKNFGKIILESKEDMETRGLSSPDIADALALTFAHPVMPRNRFKGRALPLDLVAQGTIKDNNDFAKGHDYNPLNK